MLQYPEQAIHHFPKQCADGVCTTLTSIGGWTTSNGTYWETDEARTFALNASAPHLLVGGRGPARIVFRGLPHPSRVKTHTNRSVSTDLVAGRCPHLSPRSTSGGGRGGIPIDNWS